MKPLILLFVALACVVSVAGVASAEPQGKVSLRLCTELIGTGPCIIIIIGDCPSFTITLPGTVAEWAQCNVNDLVPWPLP